jgi:hypothetical protein
MLLALFIYDGGSFFILKERAINLHVPRLIAFIASKCFLARFFLISILLEV